MLNQSVYNKEQVHDVNILKDEAKQQSRYYSYSNVGELLKIEDSRKGITNYHYDKLGRVKETIKTKGSIETKELFSFDPAHNLLNDEYDKPLKNNQIETYQDKRFKYDTFGNLTHKKIGNHTDMELSYNAEHQLTQAIVTKQRNSHKPITQTYSYTYDPFGRRVSKSDAFGTTYFTWDGNRLLTEQRGESSQSYIYEQFGFTPIASTNQEAKISYYHNDHLGTPQEVTNSQGDIVWEAEYETWGNTAKVSYKGVDVNIQDDVAFQPLRFQGQYFDQETGLHYNRFRYYDPDIGRFISQDPIGLMGGMNLYQYASNPVSWVDPLGLKSNSQELRENMGSAMSTGSGRAAHHLIPVKSWERNENFLNDIGLGGAMNSRANGLDMPTTNNHGNTELPLSHRGGHPRYIERIDNQLDDIKGQYDRGEITKTQARKAVSNLQKQSKKDILNKEVESHTSSSGCIIMS